ncbi:tautomerase family protein [Pseudonocardia sp.]|uniref:tautomerase family protein n=1 Tax=Pseudonocardia sp. TaxID=60912 RepID=UPI003D0C3E01
MPFIQVDITEGLTPAQLAELRERIVEIVHHSIGSARAHINVAIHELPATRIVEAGRTVPDHAVASA